MSHGAQEVISLVVMSLAVLRVDVEHETLGSEQDFGPFSVGAESIASPSIRAAESVMTPGPRGWISLPSPASQTGTLIQQSYVLQNSVLTVPEPSTGALLILRSGRSFGPPNEPLVAKRT